MSNTTFEEVSSYQVLVYGGPDGNNGVATNVSLTIPEAYTFLQFFPQGSDLKPNSSGTHSNGYDMYYVSYQYDQLANVLDLLRNEKPIKFFFNKDNNSAYITTGTEPIGEGESS
ncbi:MAG: hypothetical protein QNK37_14910 [Acidobacteriota bacterium]|nr:hypothetical protein [Acidobacteriota bacterium]